MNENDKQAELVAFNGWYCAQCQRGVAPSEVTFHETHAECGRYITDDEPPTQPVRPAKLKGDGNE